jgi:hypothetical protein
MTGAEPNGVLTPSTGRPALPAMGWVWAIHVAGVASGPRETEFGAALAKALIRCGEAGPAVMLGYRGAEACRVPA